MSKPESAVPERFRAVVVARRELSPAVSRLRLRVLGTTPLDWIPGQYLLLSTDDAPSVEIPYSIASAPSSDNPLELELALSNSGNRELLAKLVAGTELDLSRARGAFIWRPREGATLFVGIGTGLAPLRAMLQAALAHASPDPVALLFGARSEEELLWRDELERLAREHARFRFEPTLSRPSEAWRGRRGRVQDHLEEIVPRLDRVQAYLCGSQHMVDDCVVRLIRGLGVDPARISSEAFS